MIAAALALFLGLSQAAPVPAPTSAPKAAASKAKPKRPQWTYARPHYETRKGRKVAVAVGRGKAGKLGLARDDAEQKARAALLKFVRGKDEGALEGAAPVEFFEAGGGVVYARLELPVP